MLTAGETKRKLVHIGVGGFALLLRFLDWRGAAALALGAFLFNWQILPRVGGKQLWRGGEQAKGYPLGILLYPLSVLGLCLYFRHDLAKAAAVWGLLAVGDGMATLLGQALRGPRLPWNPGKGWIGFASFIVFGTLAASFLMVWTLRLPLTASLTPRVLALTVPLTLLCALVETLPTTLDDNLTVPLTGAVALTLLAQADFAGLLAAPGLGQRLLLGLAVNGVVALAAKWAGSIDIPGALSAVFIGTVITGTLGLRGFALMAAFFVLGSLATRIGYRVKAARGIAQEKGGARGWRNAWANGGVPALLALMAGAAPSDMQSLFLLAYAAAVATAAADTCSSEVGKAYGRRTFLITSLRPVPAGTEGAVSLEGTLGGFLGGALIAALGAALGLYPWLAAVLVALAGLLGSLAESVLGTVAERKGWLDNDLLNALNTALGAGFVVLLLRAFPIPS
ncbi:MAG TPA: DUF92 domain-containing protein [Vicinamibacteria bacterium]|nr:DUF92 domain-containing protein [Vicinamibacteria bacterium]